MRRRSNRLNQLSTSLRSMYRRQGLAMSQISSRAKNGESAFPINHGDMKASIG